MRRQEEDALNPSAGIQGPRTWHQDSDVDGQDTTTGPPPDPSAAARATRALATDRYQTFVSSGRAAFEPCEDYGAPGHDYDKCVTEQVKNPVLFKLQDADADPIDSLDVRQAGVGDCHYLAPLAALAATPRGRAFIRSAVVENKNEAGEVVSWTVTLHQRDRLRFIDATYREVQVTVRQPFVVGHSAIRGKGDPNEVWPMVFEKAYAQLAGGYDAIGHGGAPFQGMEVLTGREPSVVSLGWITRLFKRYGGPEMQNDLANGKLIVLTSVRGLGGELGPQSTTAERQAKAVAHGLLERHAYFVTGVEQHDGKPFVRLGNPWGEVEPDPVPCDELTKWFSDVTVGAIP
jgi:Calpain family cysteine protease